MCHDLLASASFWQWLYEIDWDIAAQVRASGCPFCGGVLHSARYPRKPRGASREVLGPAYESRLSFCCNQPGCRRRCTPPSVRYLGARVYLGVIVTLVCAVRDGLTDKRRRSLIEQLSIDRRTLQRWIDWWTNQLPSTAFWRSLRGRVTKPELPLDLLGVVQGDDLEARVIHFLGLIKPLSTRS